MFHELDSWWGPQTVDRFADYLNAQLPQFNSRFWSPDTKAVDAFTCDWGSETNGICPPPYLILRVKRHAQKTKAKGTLVVPLWKLAPFWPMLFPCKDIPAKFVMDMLVLMKSDQLVQPGKSGCSLFKLGHAGTVDRFYWPECQHMLKQRKHMVVGVWWYLSTGVFGCLPVGALECLPAGALGCVPAGARRIY